MHEKNWRQSVEKTIGEILKDWDCSIAYPEDYNGNYFDGFERKKQLELC